MAECEHCYKTLIPKGRGRPQALCDDCAQAISAAYAARKPWDSDCAYCGRTLVMVRLKPHATTCTDRCRQQLNRVLRRWPAERPRRDAGTASLFE